MEHIGAIDCFTGAFDTPFAQWHVVLRKLSIDMMIIVFRRLAVTESKLVSRNVLLEKRNIIDGETYFYKIWIIGMCHPKNLVSKLRQKKKIVGL